MHRQRQRLETFSLQPHMMHNPYRTYNGNIQRLAFPIRLSRLKQC